MTHSSIGSGPSMDNNENHPADGLPNKTMGEETQASPTASGQTMPVRQDQKKRADAPAESDLASSQEIPGSVPVGPVDDNPGNFPDGPNVAPSPWEKDAAQGKG